MYSQTLEILKLGGLINFAYTVHAFLVRSHYKYLMYACVPRFLLSSHAWSLGENGQMDAVRGIAYKCW